MKKPNKSDQIRYVWTGGIDSILDWQHHMCHRFATKQKRFKKFQKCYLNADGYVQGRKTEVPIGWMFKDENNINPVEQIALGAELREILKKEMISGEYDLTFVNYQPIYE